MPRRAVTRATYVAVPVLVAVVLAVLLVAGGSPHRPRAIDVRDAVARVSAQTTQLAGSHGVLQVVSDEPGGAQDHQWWYTDPANGTESSLIQESSHGRFTDTYWNRARSLGGNRVANVALEILPAAKTIEKATTRVPPRSTPISGPPPPPTSPTPSTV